MKTITFSARLLLLLGLVLSQQSCRVITKKYPVDRVVLANNERDLWSSLRVAINKQEYSVGRAGADPVKREIVSGWKVTTAPFRRNSWRKRVIATYEPFRGGVEAAKEALGVQRLDPDLEVFSVSIRVQKDDNKSLRAIDARYADWTPADDDLQSAEALMLSFIGFLGTEQFQLGSEQETPFGIE